MKKYLLAVIFSFQLTGLVSAQMSEADIQKSVAAAKRAGQLRDEAESRAMEECNTTRAVYSYPSYKASYHTEDTKISLTEETREGGDIAQMGRGVCRGQT